MLSLKSFGGRAPEVGVKRRTDPIDRKMATEPSFGGGRRSGSAASKIEGIIDALTSEFFQPDLHEVDRALDLIRANGAVPPSELRLLVYLVHRTLAGHAGKLHQRTIAADVFGRDLSTFDPRGDSTVRTMASNLRNRLNRYYQGRGQTDPVRIELNPGSYVPVFCAADRLSQKSVTRLWSARADMELRTVSGYRDAIRQLDGIIAESPASSIALALKAEALACAAIHGTRPRPNLEEARQLAERAVSQPRPAWQAWLAHAIVKQSLEWDWKSAEDSYRKAIEFSGGVAAMNVWYTAFLAACGRPKEGAAHLQRAVDYFGYSNAMYLGDLSMMLILARDYEAAETSIEAALKNAPGYYQHYLHLAILQEALGNPQEALRTLDRTPLKMLERPVTWGLRGLFAGFAGKPQTAQRRLSWMRAISRTGLYIPASQVAACRIGLGDVEQAVTNLEKAADERDPISLLFWAYPMTRHLRGNARFEQLIDTIGLVRY